MNARRKVLVADDEEGYRLLAREILSRNYAVLTANDGQEALALAKEQRPDLILLDIRMPTTDGVEICARLRADERTRHIPVLMLTAAHDVAYRVQAFSVGADDFISKPFTVAELLARVDSKVRRLDERSAQAERLVFENLEIDVSAHRVLVDGKPVSLTANEFKLLKFLVENPDRVLSRDEILSAVWANCFVSDRVINTHLSTMRRKLKGMTATIESIYGMGYILRASQRAE